MPSPSEVNPRKFKVEQIVYNLNEFSIAWGVWEEDSHRLAMRWNGDDRDMGYPKTFGYPVWFVLPTELSLPILQAIGAYGPNHRCTQEA